MRDFYVDLDNIKDIASAGGVGAALLEQHQTGKGYQKTYRVHDRIPLGPLSMPISYWARVEVPQHGDVITEARQFPRVRLNGTVTFPADRFGHPVDRTAEHRSAPAACRNGTEREAVNAHVAMLAGIRGHFEASRPRG